jgi:hypothetical protein
VNLYPVNQLYEEMAFIAFHFHWSRDELMTLEHGERRRWCDEISSINRRFNEQGSTLLDVNVRS